MHSYKKNSCKKYNHFKTAYTAFLYPLHTLVPVTNIELSIGLSLYKQKFLRFA